MATPVLRQLDFLSRRGIIGLAPAQAAGEAVEYSQLVALASNSSWKDSVRAATTVNINLSAPGATIDGVTMVLNDSFLAKDQTTQTQNGPYVWNGAATPATRRADSTTFTDLEAAIVMVEEGTANAITRWRQTQVNGVIGTNSIIFASDAVSAPAASETTAGILEIATQAETDALTDDLRAITSLKLANWSGRIKRFSQTIGDGVATSIPVNHNLGIAYPQVIVAETGGSKRLVSAEVQYTNTTTVTVLFDVAPTTNQYTVAFVG